MSNADTMTPKIGTLHYKCHFEMLTPIKFWFSFFFIFWGDCQRFTWLQQQQDELDDHGPSTRSPYNDKGQWQRDRWVPRPCFVSPPIIAMDSVVTFGE